jgi:hypothetical protein
MNKPKKEAKPIVCLLTADENGRLAIKGKCFCKEAYLILLFKGRFCVRAMTKSPSECRFAYLKKTICLNEAIRRAVHNLPYLADEQGEYEAEKVLVLPIGPRSSYKMVDGTNDLIVLKKRIVGAGIKFK